MAWILAMAGENFWAFNVMEAFATIAILVTAGIALYKWRKEKKRQNTLIYFPNNWLAKYNETKKVIEFQVNANVLIPFHAFQFDVKVFVGRKKLRIQNVESGQPIIPSTEGRIYLTGEIPISLFPNGMTELEIKANITLDGAVKRVSGKRTVPISNIGLLKSHKEGSQT